MSTDKLTIRSADDVVEAVNSGRVSGGYEKAIVLIALGGIFIDAYDFTSLAFGLKDITTEFQLGSVSQGVVAASIMVGAFFGAVFGGYLVDRIGRYRMFMARHALLRRRGDRAARSRRTLETADRAPGSSWGSVSGSTSRWPSRSSPSSPGLEGQGRFA